MPSGSVERPRVWWGCVEQVIPLLSSAAPLYQDLEPGRAGSAPFAVIGDTQDTLFWEKWFLLRESNPVERAALFSHLAAHRPEFLVHLGDLTCDGGSEARWREFDRLTEVLRGIVPLLPVMGNHDYWLSRARADRQLHVRFPQLRPRPWYTRAYGRLALVVLDTNARVLSSQEWQEQQAWYGTTLAACDKDPAIAGVLVFAHHPPYTNSTVTRDDAAVQRAFVPALAGSRKTLAMISGHTHAYEHFLEQGKHFIVAGGGGGPRVRLRSGMHQVHQDLCLGAAPRPFHFLWMTPVADGVRVEVKGLEKGATALQEMDQFDLRARA